MYQPAEHADCDDPSDEYQNSLQIRKTVDLSGSCSVDEKSSNDSDKI
jgi:hypothetical protein